MGQKGKRGQGASLVPEDVAGRDSDYGSFEVVSGPSKRGKGTAASNDGHNWFFVAAVVVVLGLAGTGFAVFAVDGDDESQEEDGSASAEETGFQPYEGGAVPGDDIERDESEQPDLDSAWRAEMESDEGESDRRADDRGDSQRPIPRSLSERDIDGEEIVEDSRGQPISQREAQDRVERELESLEDSEVEYHRRLRRRDIERNSRVLQRADDGMEVSPGVQVSEDVQRRLKKQFGERGMDDTGGVDADDYRGVEDDYYEEDEYYDDYYEDDYYEEDEYHGDYYYDDDYYDE